jgi:hypothetical protein
MLRAVRLASERIALVVSFELPGTWARQRPTCSEG